MTLPVVTPSSSGHVAAHNTLHDFYNAHLEDHSGIRYVTIDGDDTKDGRSWQTAKSTLAGAKSAAGTVAKILVGSGMGDVFDIDETLELSDGQIIDGINPHPTNGTKFQATSALGTDPMFANTTGNLTSGGLYNFQARGTLDANGGVGLLISGGLIADMWTMDNVLFGSFTSHGVHFDLGTGEIAGNPLFLGVVNCFSNGQGGVGDGFHLERPTEGTVTFRYLGGDNNFGSLLYIDNLNAGANVRIYDFKAERSVSGRHQNIIDIGAANGGALTIGGFRMFHNVSGVGSVDGDALIRCGDASLRLYLDNTFITTSGSRTYTNGYTDPDTTITLADFIQRPWIQTPDGIGLRHGTGLFTRRGSPEGVYTAPPGSMSMDRTNGKVYIKGSGFGNTGWLEIATV